MVGTRRPHRVGRDHVLAVRRVSQAREVDIEDGRQGDGRRSKKWSRKVLHCQR